jgi:hypothetical protein
VGNTWLRWARKKDRPKALSYFGISRGFLIESHLERPLKMVSSTVLTNADEQVWRLLGLSRVSPEMEKGAPDAPARPADPARLEDVLL